MPTAHLVNLPIHDFLDRLASDAPTPGGGAAAAFAGAMAAGLAQMVSRMTLGRPKFAAVEAQVRDLLGRFERTEAAMRELIDEDAAAYGALHAAFQIDKNDPDRPAKLEEAARMAAQVPLEVAVLANALVDDLAELSGIGNPRLAADVQTSRALAIAARAGGLANCEANVPLLSAPIAEMFHRELQELPRE